MAPNDNSLRELYIEELRHIYNAEKQLTKVLPKMAKAATSGELGKGFTEHLERTSGHVERLEQIFERHSVSVPRARGVTAWKV